jgi:hypothetical protein
MFSIRYSEPSLYVADEQRREDILRHLDNIRRGILPSVRAEAQHLVNRFYQAVRRNPEAFASCRLYAAVCGLEKAVAKTGARLEHLGTSRKQIFHEAHGIVVGEM